MNTHALLPTLLLTTALAGFTAATAPSTDPHQHHPAQNTDQADKPYPLETCLISGEKLGSMGDPVVIVREGREFKLCCSGCKKDLEKDWAKQLAAFDKAFAKVKRYAGDTCLVSGEKLDSMGKPYAFVHQGQEIKLCCKSCLKEFRKDPKKFTDTLPKAPAHAAE